MTWSNRPANPRAGDTYVHDGVTYVARKDSGHTVWDVKVTERSGGSPSSLVKHFSRFYCGDGNMDGHLYGIVLIDQANNIRVGIGNNKCRARGWHDSYARMNTLPIPTGETPKSVTATYENTLVLTTNGNVLASGRNAYRQLALTDSNNAEENNNGLRQVKGTPSRVRKIITGGVTNLNIFYLLENNKLYGSGYNPYGYAFGRGDNKHTGKNGGVTPMYDITQNINNGNSRIQDFMWCGYHGGGIGYHYNQTAVALTTDGHIYTSGYNGYGSRGDGTTGNGAADKYQRYHRVVQGGANVYKFVKIKASAGANAHAVYALTDGGELLGWGYNGYGQLANGNTTSTGTPYLMATGVQDFWCGGGHHASVFIKKSDGIHSCGYGGYGQLGHNNTTAVNSSFKKVNSLPTNVEKIFTSGYHSQASVYARTTDGRLYACGYNGYGQLGLGDFTNRKVFEQIDLPCYPAQVRNMGDMYGSGNGRLLIADPAGELYACGSASYYMFNEGGGRHLSLLTKTHIL